MRKSKLKLATIPAIALLAGSVGVTNTVAQSHDEEMAQMGEPPAADAVVAGEFIDFSAHVQFDRAVVRITGPKNYAATIRVPAGTSAITADLLLDAEPAMVEDLDLQAYAYDTDGRWHTLPDGEYRYELVMSSGGRIVDRIVGDFHVENGVASDDDFRSQGSTHNPTLFQQIAGAALELLIPSARAQSNLFSNLILLQDDNNANRSWVSYDNDNQNLNWRVGHASGDFWWNRGQFGLNAANVMVLRDLSSGGRLGIGTRAPASQLHIATNASTASLRLENTNNGYRLMSSGSSGFSIAQISPFRTPFRIDPDAPTNSIRVDEDGNVGLGVANPTERLSVNGSARVTNNLRINNTLAVDNQVLVDTTTSSGCGNAVVCIRGDRSHLLRIRPEEGFSGQTALAVRSNSSVTVGAALAGPERGLYVFGDTGIGISNPAASLHIRRGDGTAGILIQETQSIATNTMLTMRHNGNPGFEMENTGSGALWQFRLGGSGAMEQFTVNKVGTGQAEAAFSANGNLRIAGSLVEGSSRSLKQDIKAIDPEEVLARLSDLMLAEWSYTRSPSNRHFGPMAEDFHELFGLGMGPETVSPRDLAGVAVAAAQALNDRNQELSDRNQKLTKTTDALADQNQDLIQRIERLEQASLGNAHHSIQ